MSDERDLDPAPQASSLRQLAHGTLVLTAFQFASKPLLAVFFLLLGNRAFFAEHEYGRLESILALVNVFLILADFGLEPYTTRRLARDAENSGEWMPRQASLKSILTLGASLVLAAWMIGMAVMRGEPLSPLHWVLAVLLLIALASQSYLRGITRAHGLMAVEGLMTVVEKASTLVLGVVALWLAASVAGVLAAVTVGSLAAATYAFLKVRAAEPGLRWGWPPDWRALSHAFPFALGAICITLFYNMDRVMLSVAGDLAVAPYSRALRITWALLLFPQMMSIAVYPILSRLKDDEAGRLDVGRRSLQALLFIAFPFAVGGWMTAGGLVDLLFRGPESAVPTWPIDVMLGGGTELGNSTETACLRVLLLGLPFICGNYLFGPALNAQDRVMWNLKASAMAAAMNFGLNLALIPMFGPVGAAGATTFTQGVYCLVMYRYLRGLDASWLRGNRLPSLLICALGMGGVLYPLAGLPVLLRIGIGAVVYLAATRLLGLWPVRELKQLIPRGTARDASEL